MKLMTWNVQWCRGVDLNVDPARIVAEAKRIADFDVLCLQEVADNFPDPELGGSAGEDQFAVLASLLPGYAAVPGVAVDQPGRDGRRRRVAGKKCPEPRELVFVGVAGEPRIRKVVGDLLQAQHVEVGELPRLGDNARRIDAAIDTATPLDVPLDELHRIPARMKLCTNWR